jgi:hypothetical protein
MLENFASGWTWREEMTRRKKMEDMLISKAGFRGKMEPTSATVAAAVTNEDSNARLYHDHHGTQ